MNPILARIILILLLALSATAVAQNTVNPGISVTGQGEIAIPNSEARISTGVTTIRMTADESLAANSALTQAVFDALISAGIDENDIETAGFNFNAVYDWVDGERIFEGYQVTHAIHITVSEIESLGPVLDLLVTTGVTQINRVSFGADDFESIKQQAITLATTDAASKAQLLADSTGVSLGEPVRISLSSSLGSITTDNFDAAAFSSPPPIAPGSHTVRASVSITYSIGQ